MRVAVIGAGVVGVTTAYELAADGHEVSVYECHDTVASGTSFANAGVVAPGYVTPWAAPGMPAKVLRHLFETHAPVRFGGANAAALLPWMWRWWRACKPTVYRANRQRMALLARYSSKRLRELTGKLDLDYENAQGVLVLLRGARELSQVQASLQALRELDFPFDLLDSAQCRKLEPALNEHTPLHAAIGLPRDAVGNCRQFAQLLKSQAQERGARFLFRHEVLALQSGKAPRVDALREGAAVSAAFDAVVVCAGHQANRLLRPLGSALPIVPVYGYSVTAPLQHLEGHPLPGPRAAVLDEKYKVAVSRLGQRIRVSGSAELGGSSAAMNQAALATLYKVLDDWFPGAARLSQASAWKGARPMLPDGPPVLGRSRAAGIWLNLGHGSSGWALSCGSARVLADLVAARTPAIDITGLGIERLGR
jgi:D-amino-acid dehydrogenase